MKKTILYLSLVSTLAIPQGMAVEEQDVRQGAPEIARLQQELAKAHEKIRAQNKHNGDLQQEVDDLNQAQKENEQLLETVLTQHHQIREGTLFLVENNVAPLSACQQKLLSRWEQGQIGEKAWSALGGDHLSLATALFQAIQGIPDKKVEISCLKVNNFKLRVGEEDIQKRSYKF